MHKGLSSKIKYGKLPYARSLGRFSLGAIAIVMTFSLHSAFAQEPKGPEEAKPTAISPAKEASIRKMLELTGARQHAIDFGAEVSEQMSNLLQKNLPPGQQTKEISEALVNQLTASLSSEEF